MKKTLVPLTQAQLELLVACLSYCEAHPSHRDIEITDLKERILFYSLKDKCFEPTKVYANGIKRKPNEEVEKPAPAPEAKPKRNYNKTKGRKPPFNFES